jgi:hypothetical protein
MSESKHVLTQIQAELKAPKGQYNSFGKYKYRSVEDILEAVKPKLAKYNAKLVLTDEPVMVGDRIYIKATCTYEDTDGQLTVTGYAREANTKKGMDDSQITGAASSYARKYALDGLFLIDDTKDADTDAYYKQTHQAAAKQPVPAPAKKATKADYDKAALEATTTVNGQPVLIVQLVAEAENAGNQESAATLKSLTGRDHKIAGYIYKNKLYKNWPN